MCEDSQSLYIRLSSERNPLINLQMESDANCSSGGVNGGEKPPPPPNQYECYYRNPHLLPHALLRHPTSPPRFFSQFHSLSGYGNGDLTPSSIRSKNHTSFLSRLGRLEHENEAKVANANCMVSDDSFFSSPMCSWNDSSPFTESFAIKREPDNDQKLLGASNKLLPSANSRPAALSHHLSLPKTLPEMLAVEKLLHLQDTVPCKIRAKRGCATHPRSIAERVRRTRISERMRKLQELVPNMDKQTNTADMLDLAVDYIKDLQKQYTVLNDNRANCKCSAFHQ